MTDEHNRRLQQEHDDAALGLLMEEYAEIEGEALWREFQVAEAARNGPQEHKREHRESGRRSRETYRRTKPLKRIGNGLQRAAILVLILICLLSPVVMSAEAFKLPVLNYIVAIQQKFSGLNFGVEDARVQKNEDLVDLICSTIYPEGYHFSRKEVSSYGKIWIYLEDEKANSIIISIYPPNGQFNIDTENVDQVPMKLMENEAFYLRKEGHRIMWMDAKRNLVFDVHAFALDEEAFWRYIYMLAEKISQLED